MNSDVPMRLQDIAAALPPAELRSTWEFRTRVLFPSAITCGVAAGILTLPSLIYGTYQVSVARDWNYILVPIMTGVFMHPFISAGVGYLVHLAVWSVGNRLFVDRLRDLETQVLAWQKQAYTPIDARHVRVLNHLASPAQLGRVLGNLNVEQQLLLRHEVGAKTFECAVVPASSDRVKPYWIALHALGRSSTDLAVLCANQQFRAMLRRRPKYLQAIGLMIAQERCLTPQLKEQLERLSASINGNAQDLAAALRHIELARYCPRTAQQDFVPITAHGNTYYGHPGVVQSEIPEVTHEEVALFDLYLTLLHRPFPDPLAINQLSSVQRLTMISLMKKLSQSGWQPNDAIVQLSTQLNAWYADVVVQITPQSLRRCWETACRPGLEWMKPVILSVLEQGSGNGFTPDVIFALWNHDETPGAMRDWLRQQVGMRESEETQ